MLIDNIHWVCVTPGGIVRPPALHVPDADCFRPACLNSVVELTVTFGIVVALVAVVVELIVVILVANLYETHTEGFGMPGSDTFCTPDSGGIAISVLQSVESFLNEILDVLIVLIPSVTHAHVDHKHWLCAQIFSQL